MAAAPEWTAKVAPQLRFHLAMVELRCYSRDSQGAPCLIVPRVVVKTAEVERAMVRIELADEIKGKVKIVTTVPAGSDGAGRRIRLTFDEFYGTLGGILKPDVCGRVREFIEKVEAELPSINISLQKRMMFDWESTQEDSRPSERLILISPRDAKIMIALRQAGKEEFPALERYWKALTEVHVDFKPIRKTNGSIGRKEVPIDAVVNQLDRIFEAMREFVLAAEFQVD